MRRSLEVTKTDTDLFARVVSLAELGEHRVRVGALIVNGKTPLCASWNRQKNDVKNVEYGNATVHAEQHTLRTCNANLDGLTLYVARIGRNKDQLPSFPCDRCIEVIEADSRISKLVYYDGQSLVKVRI